MTDNNLAEVLQTEKNITKKMQNMVDVIEKQLAQTHTKNQLEQAIKPNSQDLLDQSLNFDEISPEINETARKVELLLFINNDGLTLDEVANFLPDEQSHKQAILYLQHVYSTRGINLRFSGGKYQFTSATDLAYLLSIDQSVSKKLSRAATETLAIIAYHQPCTRPEIEAIRGVSLSPGTLDILLDIGWIKTCGRRKNTPGKPLQFATTDEFLKHFSLQTIDELPAIDEMKKMGLLNIDMRDGLPSGLLDQEAEVTEVQVDQEFQEDFLKSSD